MNHVIEIEFYENHEQPETRIGSMKTELERGEDGVLVSLPTWKELEGTVAMAVIVPTLHKSDSPAMNPDDFWLQFAEKLGVEMHLIQGVLAEMEDDGETFDFLEEAG
jgi:hypothetical protein